MRDKAYLLVLDGFADWEASLAAAEINKSQRYHVVTMGLSKAPVESMGGLQVMPDITKQEMDVESAAVLIVPGGTSWEEGENPEVTALLRMTFEAGVPIAALCGATIGLARAGLLTGRRHTSNMPGYLSKWADGYDAEEFYVDQPAVRDGDLITASGMGGVEFALEVIRLLALYDEADQEIWLQIFRDKRVPLDSA